MDTKTLCLGVLYQGQASGYEIKKHFEEGAFGHIHETSFGAIYPALAKLAEEGSVECTELAQEKRPDKKVYSITPKGHTALLAALMGPPEPDKVRSDILFILYFAHLLPPPRVAELIDQRIAWYDACLARMRECEVDGRPAGKRFVHGLGLAVYSAAVRYLRERRETLLAELDRSQLLVAE